jgi:hypothetical protein
VGLGRVHDRDITRCQIMARLIGLVYNIGGRCTSVWPIPITTAKR